MKRPASRPRLKIDWREVDKMLQAQCTGTEIAARLGVHPDTLYDRCVEEKKASFSHYSQEKKSDGRSLLRIKQYSAAMQGDKTLMIWLGKNILNQSEKQNIQHSGGAPLQVICYSANPLKPWKEEDDNTRRDRPKDEGNAGQSADRT